jgi:hypothetical protein
VRGARRTLEFAAVMVLTWAALLVPDWIRAGVPPADPQSSRPTILRIYLRAWEGLDGPAILAFVVVGLLVGVAFRLRPLEIGGAAFLAFLALCSADIAYGGDHNLLPFELVFYAIVSCAVLAGAFLVRLPFRRKPGSAAPTETR